MSGMKWNALTRRQKGEKAALSHGVSFWFLAVLLGFFLFAASAPSPLYGIYEAMWHFSPIILTAIYAVYALAALAGEFVLFAGGLAMLIATDTDRAVSEAGRTPDRWAARVDVS